MPQMECSATAAERNYDRPETRHERNRNDIAEALLRKDSKREEEYRRLASNPADLLDASGYVLSVKENSDNFTKALLEHDALAKVKFFNQMEAQLKEWADK